MRSFSLFCKKVLCFGLILFVLVILLDLCSMSGPGRGILAALTGSSEYISVNTGADEIRPYIEKVQTEDGSKILILGDSVCRQLMLGLTFPEEVCAVGSNAAITPAGQYILAKEYIDAHPQATDIYLFLLPSSLTQTFDTGYGYQYAVMPFAETGTINDLDPETIRIMEVVYGKLFMQPKIVRMIDRSGPNRKLYLNLLKKRTDGYKPENELETAEIYIRKIREYCDKNGVTLHLNPCPVSEEKKKYTEKILDKYKKSPLYEDFPSYCDAVRYFPAEEFSDGTHFGPGYDDRSYFDEVLSSCYGDLFKTLVH